MKVFNKKIRFIVIILLFLPCYMIGQNEITLQFMQRNPYFNNSNPANFVPYNGYVGVPGIGNLNVNFTNTAFHYKNFFETDNDGYPVKLKLRQFADKLHKNQNWLNTSINEEILGFGFRVKSMFFTFSTRLRAEEYLKFNKDLFGLPIYGNIQYLGKDNPAKVNANFSLDVWQEFSITAQANIGKRLSIGVRPKLLLGLASIKTNMFEGEVVTDPDDFSIKANYNVNLYAAFPIDVTFENGKVVFPNISANQILNNLKKQLGFAIDLGATFKISDRFGVGASVNDLGVIAWKLPGLNLKANVADNGEFYNKEHIFFEGLTSQQIVHLLSDNVAFSNFIDTLKGYFPYEISKGEIYNKMLHGKITIEAYCQLAKNHRFTLLVQGIFAKKSFIPRLTAAYNIRLLKVFDLVVNYSIMPSSYSNLGLGIGIELWPLYLYFATDNIISACKPLNGNLLSIQTGICFKFGKADPPLIKEAVKK